MTRQEHLLTIAIEACGEVAQRLSKILRFGITEVQPGQTLTNEDRFYAEFCDLRAVLGMAGLDAWMNTEQSKAMEQAKVAKVTRYLAYSAEQGTLTDDVRCPSCQSLRQERIAGLWLCQVCGHEWDRAQPVTLRAEPA
jgi:rubredoxin